MITVQQGNEGFNLSIFFNTLCMRECFPKVLPLLEGRTDDNPEHTVLTFSSIETFCKKF